MNLQIRDRSFARRLARCVLARPSHLLADALVEVHDHVDGLELHIRPTHGGSICLAWINRHAYVLPGTSPEWLTVDDLFGVEHILNKLIAELLQRHSIAEPTTNRGVA